MKTIRIRAEEMIYYDQHVEMEDEDFNRLTGKKPCEEWEKDAIIDDYLNKYNIYTSDGLDEIQIEEITEINS